MWPPGHARSVPQLTTPALEPEEVLPDLSQILLWIYHDKSILDHRTMHMGMCSNEPTVRWSHLIQLSLGRMYTSPARIQSQRCLCGRRGVFNNAETAQFSSSGVIMLMEIFMAHYQDLCGAIHVQDPLNMPAAGYSMPVFAIRVGCLQVLAPGRCICVDVEQV